MPAPRDRAPVLRAARSACHPSLSVQDRALSCPRSMPPSVVLRFVVSGCFAASALPSPCPAFILDDGDGEEELPVTSCQWVSNSPSKHFGFPQNLLCQTRECD